jgi:hypothetical protein
MIPRPTSTSEVDVKSALAMYSQSLHKYTQDVSLLHERSRFLLMILSQLWMEARLKAELEAKSRASTRWKPIRRLARSSQHAVRR